MQFIGESVRRAILQSAASGRNQNWADKISPLSKLFFPLPCIPSRVGEGKEKDASNLLPSHAGGKKRALDLLPSLDGRGWGRVILEYRALIQKLGLDDNHQNTSILAIDKNNFFAGGKEIQCYY
jgi:hypothetical protein